MELPPEMREKWGTLRFIRYKGNGEWGSECPFCGDTGHDYTKPGDPDRWMMWASWATSNRSGKAHGVCRKCRKRGWLDDDQRQTTPTPQQQKSNMQAQIDKIKAQEEKYETKIDQLRAQRFWMEAHENMTPDQKGLWYLAGIGDWAIDFHKLGYSTLKYNGSMTIPYFQGGCEPEDLASLQYRLEHPDDPRDKYKWEKGTRAEIFRVWPQDPINEGVTIVCEGVKKALTVFQHADGLDFQGEPITIISVPSKDVPQRLIEQLVGVEILIWTLDPDAHVSQKVNGKTRPPAIARNIELAIAAGITDNRVVRTVDKIDDMFNYRTPLSGKAFSAMVKQADIYIPKKKGTTNGNHKQRVRSRRL